MKEGDLVWFTGTAENLYYDFNMTEYRATFVQHTWGEVQCIANNGTHAVVSYNAHVANGCPEVIVLLPVSTLKEDTAYIKETDDMFK